MRVPLRVLSKLGVLRSLGLSAILISCLGAAGLSSPSLAATYPTSASADRAPATRPQLQQAAASPTFSDVPFNHPYYRYIEALYQAGYTAGCSTDPLMYCPEATMNRAESAVFVERGIHGTAGLPPQPTTQTFADLPLDSWAAKWAEALWQDHYTAGCGTDPLIYCPWQGHTRAEGCVFYLHMLNSPAYQPPQPTQQTFADVPLEAWYAKWIEAAYAAGLIPACETSPELRFCPNDPLTRAMAAYMMVKAKGLPIAVSDEWTQFGHDAQRTGYTDQTVTLPWRYKWQWNGAGPDGKRQADHLAVPRFAQPITGGGRIYYIAADSVYAFDPAGNPDKTGKILWKTNAGSLGSLSSTPAYSGGFVYVAGGNSLHKLSADDGSVAGTFATDDVVSLGPLLVNTTVYVANGSGKLYSIDALSMSQNWVYAGGSAGATVPAYSEYGGGTIAYVTHDLYVHAVNALNGSRRWRVKPTPNSYECVDYAGHSCNVQSLNGAQAENGWPVIAEQHNLVFVRYRLSRDAADTFSPAPNTNAEIRSALQASRNLQPLFALDIASGSEAFIPAVLNSGAGDGGYMPMGPIPVVKIVDGKEVVYMIWRNGLTCGGCHPGGTCTDWTGYTQWCDGREDAVMGEMVLDSATISGYQAGDFRFIGSGVYREGQTDIQTDETYSFTMSGDIIFHSHWLLSQNNRITDRSPSRGAEFLNPIRSVAAPNILWRQCYCPPENPNCNPALCTNCGTYNYCPSNCPFDADTRYCVGGCFGYGDSRAYGDGFYEYHTDHNGGSTGFSVVSNGLVLVKTNDGGLIALENGNPTAGAASRSAQSIVLQSDVVGSSASEPFSPPEIPYQEASKYIDQFVTATGTIRSAVDHMPKAIYLGFTEPHDGALLVRIFAKDLPKFPYDPMTLKGKHIRVTGKVTLYWPDGVDPEIVVTDPAQIQW